MPSTGWWICVRIFTLWSTSFIICTYFTFTDQQNKQMFAPLFVHCPCFSQTVICAISVFFSRWVCRTELSASSDEREENEFGKGKMPRAVPLLPPFKHFHAPFSNVAASIMGHLCCKTQNEKLKRSETSHQIAWFDPDCGCDGCVEEQNSDFKLLCVNDHESPQTHLCTVSASVGLLQVKSWKMYLIPDVSLYTYALVIRLIIGQNATHRDALQPTFSSSTVQARSICS